MTVSIQEAGQYRSWINGIAWLKHVDRIQIKTEIKELWNKKMNLKELYKYKGK